VVFALENITNTFTLVKNMMCNILDTHSKIFILKKLQIDNITTNNTLDL